MKKFEILLIDDDMIFLMLQKRILISMGVTNPIISFSAPQEAFDYLHGTDIDTKFLIFLDINFSNTTAWDFIKTLEDAQLDSKSLIIVASSSVDKNDLMRLKDFNCIVGFIEKPINKNTIEEIRSKNEEVDLILS